VTNFLHDDFELDFSAQKPKKARAPLWYYDDDVSQSYKNIVDIALQAFDEKLAFICRLKPGAKIKVKEWKLVAVALNEAAGLNSGYLRNKDRRDVKRTVDFISSLNSRLEVAFKARKAGNVRPSKTDKKAAFDSLAEKYRKLEQMRLSEYAKTAFEENMADRLAAQQHSYVSMFQENNWLREENAKLEEQVERLQGKLVEAYEEISRLKDQLRTKSQLKVVD